MIDFLVIGGGVAGLSAAAKLAPHGAVTVLEREPHTGYHASGRSAAMFEETYGQPSTIALNRASKHWHLEVAGAKDTPRGLLLLGTAGNEDAFARDLKSMAMERIGLDDARALLPILDPDAVTQTGYHAEAWDIDTDAVLQRFIKSIRSHGGQVVTGAEVTAISRDGPRWQVTAGEAFEAREVINAAGAWADEIARLAEVQPVGLQPMRRSMARVAAPEGHDPARWPMLFGPGETWYAKPDAGALLISPADEDPVAPMDAWAEDMTLAEGIARYEAHVTTPVSRMLSNWAGLRSFSPDRNLCLGASEQPGFWWCAAQGGYGFQTAPAASQLIADLVTGNASEMDEGTIAALDPARFR